MSIVRNVRPGLVNTANSSFFPYSLQARLFSLVAIEGLVWYMPLFILPRQDCEAKFPEIGLLIHCPDFPWPHRICKVPYDIPQQQKGYAGSGIMPSAFGSGSGFPCIKGATGSAGPPAYRLGTRIAGVHRLSHARSRRGRRDGNGLCPRGCALLGRREARPQTANKCRSICA